MSPLTHNDKKYVKHLDHPNILPIYELAQCEDELPFFSMKFAAGGTLVEAGPALPREPRRAAAQGAQSDPRDRLSTADKFSHPVKFFGTSPSSFRRSKHAGD